MNWIHLPIHRPYNLQQNKKDLWNENLFIKSTETFKIKIYMDSSSYVSHVCPMLEVSAFTNKQLCLPWQGRNKKFVGGNREKDLGTIVVTFNDNGAEGEWRPHASLTRVLKRAEATPLPLPLKMYPIFPSNNKSEEGGREKGFFKSSPTPFHFSLVRTTALPWNPKWRQR